MRSYIRMERSRRAAACKKYFDPQTVSISRNGINDFMVDGGHKLAYCMQPKVGQTCFYFMKLCASKTGV